MKRFGTEIIEVIKEEGNNSVIEFSNGVRKLVSTGDIKILAPSMPDSVTYEGDKNIVGSKKNKKNDSATTKK